MRVIGYHAFVDESGNGFIADSEGHIRKEAPFFDWLLEDTASVKVCYDLDSFASCLFRLTQFTREEAVTLIEKERITLGSYEIVYFPGRYLSIGFGRSYNRPYVSFSDMSRNIEPVTHSADNIAEKAVMARDTAVKIHEALKQIGGGLDVTAIGSITKALKPILAKLSIPTHLDIPQPVVQMALNNTKGNWVEAFKVGYVKEAYDLDMSGAYASFLADLPDIRLGQWVEAKFIPEGALLGFAEGIVNRRSSVSPLLYRSGDQLYGPLGSWRDTLNLDEIRFIDRWGADDFVITNGWWWIPTDELKYPYKGIVNWLWNKRQSSSGVAKDWTKRAMAYLWGQTLADYGKDFGELYNPVYGALVESRCRLKVAEFVLANGLEDNLCHVAVDGALFDCPVELPDAPLIMGNWRVSYKAAAIIVNSGFVFVEGKAGLQEFAHSYEWLKPMLEAEPELSSYKREKNTVCSLAQSVLQDKMDQLGCLIKVSEDIDIGRETKRFYLNMPQTGAELMKGTYSSKPMSIDIVRTLKIDG
jgi:hypothetical protein